MDILSVNKFQQLVEHKSQPSLSIYMPSVKAGSETRQNPIRFKNLLTEAGSKLEDRGMSPKEQMEFLQPARELLEDREFWQSQEIGLTVFLADDLVGIYRLPLDFEERVVLNRRFHVKPLLPLFLENESYFLLALSRKDIRLFAGNRYDLVELPLPDTPTSEEQALRYDDPEQEIHYHAGATGSTGEGAIYHGHHPEEDRESNLRRFFQKVDQGVMAVIGQQSDPLLLAGLESIQPIYRQVNSYADLLDTGVVVNPDPLDSIELHRQSWKIIQKQTDTVRNDVINRFFTLQNGRTSSNLAEILAAAYHARVETLILGPGQPEIWGKFDPDSESLQITHSEEPESRDLVDLAVIHTLLNGGAVQMVEEEEGQELGIPRVAAIFRY